MLGWKTRIKSIDRVQFLKDCLNPQVGHEIAERVLAGSRLSTLQQQVWIDSLEEE